MKTIFWPVMAIALLMASTLTTACSKDGERTTTDVNRSVKDGAAQNVVVGYSIPGSTEITPFFSEDLFLEWLENYLNSNESDRYVAEDLKMWNEIYAEGKMTPLMSISFFDIKNECSNTIFIQMDARLEGEKVLYATGFGAQRQYCEGKCQTGCRQNVDGFGNLISCNPCNDPKPFFTTFEDEARWNMTHYCREKEPSWGGGKLLKAIITWIIDTLF